MRVSGSVKSSLGSTGTSLPLHRRSLEDYESEEVPDPPHAMPCHIPPPPPPPPPPPHHHHHHHHHHTLFFPYPLLFTRL